MPPARSPPGRTWPGWFERSSPQWPIACSTLAVVPGGRLRRGGDGAVVTGVDTSEQLRRRRLLAKRRGLSA
jgi:hypothetical protein